MKKATSRLALLALVILAAGCVKEMNEPAPPGKEVTWDFWASFERPGTRTQLGTPQNGHAKVLWEEGDEIKYKTSGNQGSYTIVDPVADSAHISIQGIDGDSWIYAVYGNNVSISAADQSSVTLEGVAPSDQYYTDFSQAHVSVAHAEKDSSTGLFPEDLTFCNAVGIITFKMDFSKFNIDLSDVDHVVFSSNGANICSDGSVSVSFDPVGDPLIEALDDCGTSITIHPVSGKDKYFVAVLPCELDGFQIKFFDENNVRIAKIATDKTVEIGRSKIVDLGDLSTLSAPILKQDHVNLSAEGTSNCYIAGVGDFKFKATVPGCREDLSLSETPVHAGVLWEAYSVTESSFHVGSIVELADVPLEDGYVYFTTKRRGNALIAVYNEDWSKILWSWHIWVWPEYYNDPNPLVNFSEKTYSKSGYGVAYLLDRNLGADYGPPAANNKTDIRSWGFVYQWGRKDPFQPRKRSFKPDNAQPANVLSTSVASNSTQSIQYAIEHPTTYIYSTATTKDWLAGSQNSTLWGETKTQYDPCPPGWKVPGQHVFENALGQTGARTVVPPDEYIGFNLHGVLGVDNRDTLIFYPCPGFLNGTTSQTYSESSTTTHYWTSGVVPSGTYKHCAYAMSTKYLAKQIHPLGQIFRHYGTAVRCVLDRDLPAVRVTGVSLDQTRLSISIDQSVTLKATVEPAGATNTAVTWKSSDDTKVFVDTNGKVTGIQTTKNSNGVDKPVTITVTTADGGYTATCSVSVTASDIRDLSENGTANSYIVYEPGKYSFKVNVKGNSTESVGTVTALEILWQTNMTSTYNSSSTKIIPSVTYNSSSHTCEFTITDFVNGNAVIAAKNNGTVLWSWHIWACSGYNLDQSANYQEYYNNAGTVMDRNLGALSESVADAKSIGLFYQWGRKDPFMGPAATGSPADAVTTYPSAWAKTACSSSTGTQDYAAAHPTTFITKNTNGDWMYTENSNLWGPSTKTMYDPCPPGWKVPKGGASGLWATASGQTQSFASAPNSTGHVITNILAPGNVWYPFTGAKSAADGTFTNLAQYGYYWSATHMKTGYGYSFNLYSGSAQKCLTSGNYMKAGAMPVRCVKIQ